MTADSLIKAEVAVTLIARLVRLIRLKREWQWCGECAPLHARKHMPARFAA
ncbi:Uncharacterised protein [Vibrio cholerae]|uniref:Uncharacterized protein n=1 Tax=Vibrio cholerae TaxID=666 RepID=A0A656AW31_VIBCL|nr:Uncharacterised protein [Vibrio cholerae]CSD04289.1 Uncharacterised protein [Vibrio cholerae]CSD43865.1 Uncharacterised protein [Vibrio cholerae]